MMTDLKPCPGCGPKGHPVTSLGDVWCAKCTYEAHIIDWNTRPIEDALTAENEELRGMLAFPPTAEKTIDNLTETVATLRAELDKANALLDEIEEVWIGHVPPGQAWAELRDIFSKRKDGE